MSEPTITVIGSGLTGPLLSIFLTQRGYQVKLMEKRPDIRKTNISAGRSINLALSHRGIRALKSAGVFEEIEPLLIPMKGRMVHHSTGEIKFQPYSIHPTEHINSVSRGMLNKILMTKAEKSGNVNIYFDHNLSEIDDASNELVFENKNRIKADTQIFGADGAGSVIRKYIDEKVSSSSFIDPLGHDYKELHIAPGADAGFQLEPNALHIWPREQFMLIALPNKDYSFTCTLFLPVESKFSFQSLSDSETVTDFFKDYFSDALPLLENFPAVFFENPTGKLATVYADEWHYNNQFCLVGDAAHAVVPFFGQGMNASFEDCEVLMQCLDGSRRNWGSIFKQFNAVRKVDTDAIAKMAMENYVEMRDLVAQPEYIRKKEISNILAAKFPEDFIPRYSMVSFTSISYAEVYRRGRIQSEIVDELFIQCAEGEEPDLNLAQALIQDKLAGAPV